MDRPLARTRLGLALELVDGIDQGLGVARRGKPPGDGGDPLGEIGKDRIGHPGPRQQEQRAQPLQALAGIVHAAMTVRRARQRALGDLDLAKGDAPQRLAHRV